jgi:hypothetical protein
VPDSVADDPQLSPHARIVYRTLSRYTFQGNVVRMGIRRIAELSHCNKDTACSALQELAGIGKDEKPLKNKHITIVGEGRSRRFYCLLSSVFGQKQRALNANESIKEDLVSGPRKRLATVRPSKTA